MDASDNLTWPAAVAWLNQNGYTVTFREHGWLEGLVSCPGERWLGRGSTEREVLEDVIAQALPSRAARTALPAELAIVRSTPLPAALDFPTASNDETSDLVVDSGPSSREDVIAPNDGGVPPGVAVNEVASVPTDVEAAAVVAAPLDDGADAVSGAAAEVEPAPVLPSRVQMTVDEAIEALEPIVDRIEAERPELGLATPERQRLVILSWICRARAIEDAADGVRPIVNRVAAIAKNLTALCKVYWPGSVFALQLNATPHKACRDLLADLGGVDLRTWSEAADLADRALLALEEKEAKAGLDEYGWADGFALKPAPLDPEADLAELRVRIEKATGPVDAPPPKAPAASIRNPGPKDLAQFVEWGRLARWLRCAVVDFETWAKVAGRLRWLASRIEGKDPQLGKILEPGYRPPSTWAASLGRDPVEQRKKRDRAALYRRLGGLSADDEGGVQAWLREALELLDKDAITKAVRPFRDRVVAIRVEDFTDRRTHRRRPRDVQAALGAPGNGANGGNGNGAHDLGNGEAVAAEVAVDTATAPEPENQPRLDPGAALFARVRPHTEGRNAAFISNRVDPDLEGLLRESLGFAAIDWCEGTPRRVQSVEERIGQKAFDFVLAATGFQSHCVDGALYRACKKAGIPYVRVNKGRPVACAAAIARKLAVAAG